MAMGISPLTPGVSTLCPFVSCRDQQAIAHDRPQVKDKRTSRPASQDHLLKYASHGPVQRSSTETSVPSSTTPARHPGTDVEHYSNSGKLSSRKVCFFDPTDHDVLIKVSTDEKVSWGFWTPPRRAGVTVRLAARARALCEIASAARLRSLDQYGTIMRLDAR